MVCAQIFSRLLQDEAATVFFAEHPRKPTHKRDTILRYGELGVGKTTLTQSIAVGLDVSPEQYVSSPSFALMHEYSGRLPLFHMDCYRRSGEEDIEGAGLTEYIVGPGLTVIEWPDRLGSLVPKEHLDITLKTVGETTRKCVMHAHGASWAARIDRLISSHLRKTSRSPG